MGVIVVALERQAKMLWTLVMLTLVVLVLVSDLSNEASALV